jgi:hypothetical protein
MFNPILLFAEKRRIKWKQDYLRASSVASALGFAAASLLLSTLTLGVIAGILVLKRVKLAYLSQQLAALNEVCKTLTICTMKVLNTGAEE